MERLSAFIRSKIDIPQETLSEIINHFEVRSVRKNRYLIRQGQYMNYYYFVNSGGLRVYLEHDDRAFTAWMSFENNFIVDIASISLRQPSIYNIQAIEDTELFAISCENMDMLYKKYNAWQEFGRKLWENAFLEVVTEMVGHQTLSAEERYLKFMERSEIMQRIPLKQLSSFLGITPTSLSRIRKNLQHRTDPDQGDRY